MFSKSVLQRVKQGLGEDMIGLLFDGAFKSSNGRKPESILEEFLNNALLELAQQRPFRKQLFFTLRESTDVSLPSNVRTVESLWLGGTRLTQKKDVTSLSPLEYYLDSTNRIIHFGDGLVGTVEINCAIVPREEDISPEERRALVLHVKAQCCEYIAGKIEKDPSLKVSKGPRALSNAVAWRQEAQRLYQRFLEMARRQL